MSFVFNFNTKVHGFLPIVEMCNQKSTIPIFISKIKEISRFPGEK